MGKRMAKFNPFSSVDGLPVVKAVVNNNPHNDRTLRSCPSQQSTKQLSGTIHDRRLRGQQSTKRSRQRQQRNAAMVKGNNQRNGTGKEA
jgi:hypothetical protein